MKKRYGTIRCLPACLLYMLSGKPIHELVDADVDRNLKWDTAQNGKSPFSRLLFLFRKSPEFRSIYYFRMRHHEKLVSICRFFAKDVPTIEFGGGGIGGGLMVSHYHAVIFPKEAGRNLRVGPGVIIGRNNNEFPTFGDNVYIAANSTIIGGIQIGSNVIIGAGSVVTHDIPDNSVFVGNPAHFVRNIDDDEKMLNEIM